MLKIVIQQNKLRMLPGILSGGSRKIFFLKNTLAEA